MCGAPSPRNTWREIDGQACGVVTPRFPLKRRRERPQALSQASLPYIFLLKHQIPPSAQDLSSQLLSLKGDKYSVLATASCDCLPRPHSPLKAKAPSHPISSVEVTCLGAHTFLWKTSPNSRRCCRKFNRESLNVIVNINQKINRLIYVYIYTGFPGGTRGKEPVCQCRRHKRHEFDPWVGKIPWRRT